MEAAKLLLEIIALTSMELHPGLYIYRMCEI
jgi:hypothetical protein